MKKWVIMATPAVKQFDQLEVILYDGIMRASTITEFELSMNQLSQYLQEPPKQLLLSDLWKIATTLSARVATITSLHDFDDGDDKVDQNHRAKIGNFYGYISGILAQYNLYPSATEILISLWKQLGIHQFVINQKSSSFRHIYRAGIGMYLGRLYFQREPGMAIRWLLLAHADDLLNQNPDKGGAARDMLRLSFGVQYDVFDFMEQLAEKSLQSEELHTMFAEYLVMKLSLRPDFAHLFSYPTSLVDFPVDPGYAAAMYRRIEKNPSGEPLEEMARYLVLLLLGWVPTKNIYHKRTPIDSDLIARYVREPETISEAHGRAILIECKNINESLDVEQVGYFLYRMHLTKVNVGIIFAKRNISGRSKSQKAVDARNAQHLTDLAFQQDGVAVIVVDLEDIKDIVEEKKTIWSIIDQRIVERRFGTSNE